MEKPDQNITNDRVQHTSTIYKIKMLYVIYLVVSFTHVLSSLIRKFNKTTCVLDPFPTKLSMSLLSSILDNMLCVVLCVSCLVFFQHLASPPSFFL